jgi:hypothetical protein
MLEHPRIGLRIVSGAELDREVRDCLRPGGTLRDRHGVERRLPMYFYEIPSWEAAMETRLAPNFGIWELIDVDVREPPPMRTFPRYVPCAITVLATHLQVLRDEVGSVVRIAANGGYRSPAHALSRLASTHCWGAAANIYRIGDEWMDSAERIEKYVEVARQTLRGAWVRSYGTGVGASFDHIHIDLGYLTVEPHSRSGEGEGR